MLAVDERSIQLGQARKGAVEFNVLLRASPSRQFLAALGDEVSLARAAEEKGLVRIEGEQQLGVVGPPGLEHEVRRIGEAKRDGRDRRTFPLCKDGEEVFPT